MAAGDTNRMRTDIRQYRRALQEANRVLEDRRQRNEGWSPLVTTLFVIVLILWIVGTLMY